MRSGTGDRPPLRPKSAKGLRVVRSRRPNPEEMTLEELTLEAGGVDPGGDGSARDAPTSEPPESREPSSRGGKEPVGKATRHELRRVPRKAETRGGPYRSRCVREIGSRPGGHRALASGTADSVLRRAPTPRSGPALCAKPNRLGIMEAGGHPLPTFFSRPPLCHGRTQAETPAQTPVRRSPPDVAHQRWFCRHHRRRSRRRGASLRPLTVFAFFGWALSGWALSEGLDGRCGTRRTYASIDSTRSAIPTAP